MRLHVFNITIAGCLSSPKVAARARPRLRRKKQRADCRMIVARGFSGSLACRERILDLTFVVLKPDYHP